MNVFLRAWRRLTVVTPAPTPSTAVDTEWRALIESARINAYQLGLAEGELRGRMALAYELEAQFGQDGTQDITPEAARRVRIKQVH